jgi:small subunit ribosomal protein S1
MDAEIIPTGQVSEEQDYWQAVLQQGEFAPDDAPFPEPEAERNRATAPLGGAEGQQAGLPADLAAGPVLAPVEAQRPLSPAERKEKDWQALQESFASGDAFTVRVIGFNKGGLLVRLGEVDGFVPASQLADLPHRVTAEELRAELDRRVGQEISLTIIEIDRERGRLVLSQRAALAPGQESSVVLARLKEGDVRHGRVRNLCEFGAFVDLGGVDGLIHISELSWKRVDHPSQVLQVGDEVDVYVLGVETERKRIALSLKRLRPDPWSLVGQRYQVGQLVKGTITSVLDFGAFARIEDGLEGLIHVSELAEGNFLHPRNVVREGDQVTLRIVHIDSERHRLGLSLRQAWIPKEVADSAALPSS